SAFYEYCYHDPRHLHSFPTRRSSDLSTHGELRIGCIGLRHGVAGGEIEIVGHGPSSLSVHRKRQDGPLFGPLPVAVPPIIFPSRSEEHTSELQSRENLVCRLLLENNK